MLKAQLSGLKDLYQPKQFCDSMIKSTKLENCKGLFFNLPVVTK